MKRFVLLSFMVLFAYFSAFAQGGIQFVKVIKENLLNGPNGTVIGELQAGTKMEIIERKSNWVRVQMTGWIVEGSLTSDSTQVIGFTMRASHILVKTEADVNRVLQELKAGAKFEDLAAKYSVDPSSSKKGGDVGEFKRGELMQEFDSTVLKLKIGETSGAVRSGLGYHVIKRTK